MPVFLDRHNFFKVTASDIAQIHLEDIRVQQEFGCWVLAYWCDKKRKTTFCLIDGPDLDTVKKMHSHIHHSYPSQIIQIEEDIIETFLDCIQNFKLSTRKLAPVSLFFQNQKSCAVIALKLHYSDPLLKKGYDRRKRLFENFKLWSYKLVRRNNGRIVNYNCDGRIYSFESLSQAIKVALQMQHELSILKKSKRDKTIVLNIGIAGGRVLNERSELFEQTSNLARRLCFIAKNNQIVVSSLVKEEFQMIDFGPLVKNSCLKSMHQKDEQFLTRLMNFIELNYKEDLKIGDFCKIIGESRSQLYRKIIEITNFPPTAFLNEIRLSKATELMNMQKGNNISQIAFEAGFNSLSYFSRRFKKRYGLLPSAYMNRIYKIDHGSKN
ncbi:MAG TPA: nickel-binding protein [Gillisia sp.]|nr:nickel-binding protein [Gillisia sp.]